MTKWTKESEKKRRQIGGKKGESTGRRYKNASRGVKIGGGKEQG